MDLATLQDAVFADRRLRLRYRHSGERETRTYTVDPYGLVAKAGVWYPVSDRRGMPRLSRADRVHSAALPDDPVERRPGAELADAWEVLRRPVEERSGGVDVTVLPRRVRRWPARPLLSRACTSDLVSGPGRTPAQRSCFSRALPCAQAGDRADSMKAQGPLREFPASGLPHPPWSCLS